MKTKAFLFTVALFSPFCLIAAPAAATKDCPACPTVPTDTETWISFLPAVLFFLILIITTIKLKNDGTKLSDLLAEKDPQVSAGGVAATVVAGGAAPVAAPAVAPPAQTSSQSVSRFIAFLTGLVALTIGICISTFYMYSYFSSPANANGLDLSKLTNVIWGLGIGVLPYGFNKASSAIKQ